jgi:hypothetical protein
MKWPVYKFLKKKSNSLKIAVFLDEDIHRKESSQGVR